MDLWEKTESNVKLRMDSEEEGEEKDVLALLLISICPLSSYAFVMLDDRNRCWIMV